ncbi:RNA methyltransferase [Sinanaerobacter sp. ZZT-01]|uniref:TrmH family RNA methyltransferase n=1 Tax=Sinanaerobacter sp. ZZT-01 TaxID=3111540 RepID=UPI002D79E83A|nr:RNA methyltransferase [Sinanaerobacter sp. ZZT-01]WRR93700.1 RNA methyltransferase [Sinanaerobacter sp. ZZT-01]
MRKNIESANNAIFKTALGLQKKKQRESLSQYMIEGPNLIREALENRAELLRIFVRIDEEKRSPELEGLLNEIQRQGIDIYFLSRKLFEKLGETITPQGILGVVKKPNYTEEDFFHPLSCQANGNMLVLDRLQDPGNLGTILRTADAAGFQGVILCKGTGDVFAPKVVRSAAGALFRLPLFFTNSAEETISYLHKYEKRILAATMQNSQVYYKVNLCGNIGLIIGNEGNGICQELIDAADETICIPMMKSTESLNAAVAAGILIYETVRQRSLDNSEQ